MPAALPARRSMSLYQPLRDTWSTSLSVARQRPQVGRTPPPAPRLGAPGRSRSTWWARSCPGSWSRIPWRRCWARSSSGLLNALVRPILVLLTLPLSVLTMGLVSLVINAIMLTIAAPLVPGLEIQSFGAAVLGAILITIFTTLISVILASDQDDTFYAELARRLTYSESERVAGGSGLIVVQIDGLAAPILRNAIRVGITPRMANWVRSGQYRLVEWECVPPSQTSASQAGILHGNNDNIPAFRWYEKETGRLLVSNRPADATEIERRASNGRGLLAAGGTSVGNLFSGDATRTLFTMSRMGPQDAADVSAFSLYFVDPAAFIRTVVLTITEVVKEWMEARRQVASDIQPRVHRGATFAVLRAVSNVVLRDLNVTFVMDAMRRGTPIVYVDMVDYDELAHHAGPERLETLRSLAGVDRVLGSLQRAAASAPRDYRIVVVSDHGQSQGATFRDRYGATLAEVVQGLMGGGSASSASPGGAEQGEGWGPVNALLSEIRSRPGVAGRVASSVLESRTVDGAVDMGAKKAAKAPAPAEASRHGPRQRQPGQRLLHRARGSGEPRASRGDLSRAAHGSGRAPGHRVHPCPLRDPGRRGAGPGRRPLPRRRPGGGRGPARPRSGPTPRTTCGGWTVSATSATCWSTPPTTRSSRRSPRSRSWSGPTADSAVRRPARSCWLRPTSQFEDEPIVGAPAVHRQLVRWADALGVGPGSGAGDSPVVEDRHLPEPRGIKWVAALLVLTSVPAILFAGLLLVLEVVSSEIDPLATAVIIVALLIAAASIGLAVGLLKRRRWAWFATLLLEGINVVAMLFGLATQGLGAVATYGVLGMVVAFTVFYYLTRPHVAAAFKRPRAKPSA